MVPERVLTTVAFCYSPTLDLSGAFRMTFAFTDVSKNRLHGYTCGNRIENT